MSLSTHDGPISQTPAGEEPEMSTTVKQSLSHVSAISLFVEDLQTAKSF
jgi:hypothetical protein